MKTKNQIELKLTELENLCSKQVDTKNPAEVIVWDIYMAKINMLKWVLNLTKE